MALGEIGLQISYFYSLTYRQFVNILKGFRKREEALSQERLIIMRKVMFASLLPHLKRGAKETDILEFEFEKNTVQKVTETEIAELEAQIEKQKAFWAMQDGKLNT